MRNPHPCIDRLVRALRSRGATAAVFAGAASAALATPAVAQLNGAGGDAAAPIVRTGTPAPRSFDAVHVQELSIDIDGRIDEEAWQQAEPLTGFVQGEPTEGIPAEHDTEVRLLFGEDAIYVAARMYDDEPETIARQLVRRDGEGQFDWFAFGIDPNLDRRTGYIFRVSAAGVQRDEYLFDDNRQDDAWNSVWYSAVEIDAEGWTVEMRIPLSQIRYDASPDPQSWGVNFARRRLANVETSYYKLITRTQDALVSQFAQIDDVLVPRAVRRIEARPYALSSYHQGPATPGDPFFDGQETGGRIGTDLRFGLGSSFVLDATVNPDFGQVEADPAVINLSAFEVFFEERRPFFVEDANLLSFGLSGRRNDLFYSRRIGREPRGSAPSGSDFTDVPDASSILGAAKITGRTPGGLSVGGLAAVTRRETGQAFFADDGTTQDFLAEPQSQFGVLRVQQDFNDNQSQFGAIVTAMNRSLPRDGSFDFLPSAAFTGGLSFEHQWDNRTWALFGFVAGSRVQGDSTAITRIQRSSRHFYQRPDATAESVDSTATSMTGLEWRLQFEKRRGLHWTWAVWAAQRGRGFEINELGFSQSRERLDGGMRLSYREIQPGKIFQNYNVTFFTFHNWSHDALEDRPFSLTSWERAHTSGSFNLRSSGQFRNFWGGQVNLSYRPINYSRTQTRGGPIMVEPGSYQAEFRMNSDRRKAVSFDAGMTVEEGFQDSGNRFSIGAGIEVRPSPSLEVSLQPRWESQRDAAQYVTQTGTLPYEPTFGGRYLFGDLERRSLSMVTRAELALSPTLTFQLFAQPLLTSGQYVGYRQLADAGTFDFIDFNEGLAGSNGDGGVECRGGSICRTANNRWNVDFDGDQTADFDFRDQDFNFRSLIGNAVLRWEYRPGATLFLVWQRQQASRVGIGDFDFGRDLDALWGVPADNVFIVKLNYWLGL